MMRRGPRLADPARAGFATFCTMVSAGFYPCQKSLGTPPGWVD